MSCQIIYNNQKYSIESFKDFLDNNKNLFLQDFILQDIEGFKEFVGSTDVNKFVQEVGKNVQVGSSLNSLDTLTPNEIENLQNTVENQILIEQDDDLVKKGGQSYVYLNDKDAKRFSQLIERNNEFPKEFKVTKKITVYEPILNEQGRRTGKYNNFNEYVDFYYEKINNNKKSNLYRIVNRDTSEIISEKVRVLHLSKDSKSEIAEKYGLEFKPTKVFSANRSIAFALYRQKPSKAKYIAQAKKYLYDAIKFLNPEETNLKINLDKIEDFLDSFPDEMWDYINTTYSPEDSTNINASISLQNEIKFKLPKLGFIEAVEKATGIKLQGVTFKNYDRSGAIKKILQVEWGDEVKIDYTKLTYKQLKKAVSYYLKSKKYFKPSSEEQNVRKYAEHRGIDYEKLRELVFGDFDKALENISYNYTNNSDTIELSKWRESIREYDWQSVELFSKPYENFQNTVKERIQKKFKDKILSNGISHLEYFFNSGAFNWLNINFNNVSGKYYNADMETDANVGVQFKMMGFLNPFEVAVYNKPVPGKNFLNESEVFNRLAAILHEPFHALHALSYGTKEELELRSAFDNLYNTDFGKTMMSEVFGSGYNKNQSLSYETLYKEFTAFTTQLMLYPKEWLHKTDLRSNDILEFIQKIQSLQDKTYEEIIETYKKIGTETRTKIIEEEVPYTEIEKTFGKIGERKININYIEEIKLSFLEKLYNYIVKALQKIIPLSKKFLQILPETKIVSKEVIEDLFGDIETEITKTKIQQKEITYEEDIFATETEIVTKTLKLPENIKKSKETFLQAMDELKSAINTLVEIDTSLFSSDNITRFFEKTDQYNQESNKGRLLQGNEKKQIAAILGLNRAKIGKDTYYTTLRRIKSYNKTNTYGRIISVEFRLEVTDAKDMYRWEIYDKGTNQISFDFNRPVVDNKEKASPVVEELMTPEQIEKQREFEYLVQKAKLNEEIGVDMYGDSFGPETVSLGNGYINPETEPVLYEKYVSDYNYKTNSNMTGYEFLQDTENETFDMIPLYKYLETKGLRGLDLRYYDKQVVKFEDLTQDTTKNDNFNNGIDPIGGFPVPPRC
jgi:hypothetical protein